jgi:hypothetical protein
MTKRQLSLNATELVMEKCSHPAPPLIRPYGRPLPTGARWGILRILALIERGHSLFFYAPVRFLGRTA